MYSPPAQILLHWIPVPPQLRAIILSLVQEDLSGLSLFLFPWQTMIKNLMIMLQDIIMLVVKGKPAHISKSANDTSFL